MTWVSTSATPAAGVTRVRRRRLALAVGSLLSTAVVAASALGVLPVPGGGPGLDVARADVLQTDVLQSDVARPDVPRSDVAGPWDGASVGAAAQPGGSFSTLDANPLSVPPPGSGRGRRVVFDERTQHVWLIDAGGTVTRHYPVSGSVTDNLDPGAYEVYSRSRHATGFDLSSTMQYMVRFTQGESAAIGFHSIPVDERGRALQGLSELGTPQSHGCIRQRRSDALAMWRFAHVGTAVVVV